MNRPLRIAVAAGTVGVVCVAGLVGLAAASSTSGAGNATPSITNSPQGSRLPGESQQADPVSLKENQLAPLKGFGYEPPPGGDATALASVVSSAQHPEYLQGFISRMITTPKGPVGGVQLVRFRPDTPAVDDQTVAASFEEYAQAPGESIEIGGRQVLGIDDARGAHIGVLMWADGHDLITVFAGSLADAKILAANYLRND